MRSLLLAVALVFAGAVHASPIHPMGPNVWPLGMERPFPWNSVDGVWRANLITGETTYLSLKASPQRVGDRRRLYVQQINPTTCQIYSAGRGMTKNRVVIVDMVSLSGTSFSIGLRLFNTEDVEGYTQKLIETYGETIMVLSHGSLGTSQERFSPLVKTGYVLSDLCPGI